MTDNEKSGRSWSDYRPTKALWFWSCAGTAVATMVLGFTWGGWVTGGTAEERVAEALEGGRAQLAAAICVENFVASPDYGIQLAALQEESSWARDSMIEDAGWTTLGGLEEPIDGAADLCAERLAELELPPIEEAALTVEPELVEDIAEN